MLASVELIHPKARRPVRAVAAPLAPTSASSCGQLARTETGLHNSLSRNVGLADRVETDTLDFRPLTGTTCRKLAVALLLPAPTTSTRADGPRDLVLRFFIGIRVGVYALA